MWRALLPELAEAGWRADRARPRRAGRLARRPAGTWERHAESLERSARGARASSACVPVMHDWGGLIGLRWACEQPRGGRGAVISASGLLPGRQVARLGATRCGPPARARSSWPASTREAFGLMLRRAQPGRSGATRSTSTGRRSRDERAARAQLDFYRSMDFEKIAPYEGRLAELGVPTLLVFGEEDPVRRRRHGPPLRAASCPTPSSWCSPAPGTSSGRTSRSAARAALARLPRCQTLSMEERLFEVEDAPPAARPGARVPLDLPLAARMRPASLGEFVGPGAPARARLGPADRHRGGPPALDDPVRPAGHGQDHAGAADGHERARGVRGGLGRQRRAPGGARRARARRAPPLRPAASRTIFFLDEIHRFNKAQQDTLLPAVEEGLVVLVGATTENPYFEVN